MPETTIAGAPPREGLVRALFDEPAALRSADTGGGDGRTLFGHFAVFGQWCEINSLYEGHFMEKFVPGAFKKTLAEQRKKIKVLFQHGRDPQIGEKPLGAPTILEEDDKGAYYEVPLVDTAYTRELIPGLEAGLYGSSFRFRILRDEFVQRPRRSEHNPKGLPERSVLEAMVPEFGPVTFPAYVEAGAGMRSMTDEFLLERLLDDDERIEALMEKRRGVSVSMHGTAGELGPEVIVSVPQYTGDAAELTAAVRAEMARASSRDGEREFELPDLRDRTETAEDRMYERSFGYVRESAWALHPSTLEVVVAVMNERAAGNKPSKEQIAERLALHPNEHERDEPVEAKSPVAVIPVFGPIVPHAAAFGDLSGPGGTAVETIQQKLRAALNDPAIESILLHIDSPGGSADLVQELGDEIRAARDQKPIVAMANTWAASAAYWIASQASEIVITPSGEVGSIGVYSAHTDISAAEEAAGRKTTIISAGKYKVEGNKFAALDEEAKSEIQRRVDEIYVEFVAAVAKGRGTTKADVLANFGEGRMLGAKAAVEVGMADRVATYDQTLARMQKSAAKSAGTSSAEHMQGEEPEPVDPDTTLPEEPEPSADTTPDATKNNTEGSNANMAISETIARQDEIRARQNAIYVEYGSELLPDDVRSEWDALDDEWENNEQLIKQDKQMRRSIASKAEGDAHRESVDSAEHRTRSARLHMPMREKLPENVFDVGRYRSFASSPEEQVALYREGARVALEDAVFSHEKADREANQEHIERLLEGDKDKGILAERMLLTGSPVYKRAFGKQLAGVRLNTEEQAALERAASLSTTAGGFAVPFVLDPTIILTSNGVVNPLRSIARIETITVQEWRGVSSAGVTAVYTAEATEVADGAPTLAQPTADVEKAQSFVPFSIEIGMDWAGFQGEMARLFQDAKDTLEADKFLTGLGHTANVPEGLLVGGTVVLATAAATTLARGDVYGLEEALPPRWRPRATIVANKKQFNRLRQFDTAGGSDLWVQLGQGMPRTLLGYPNYELSTMTSALTTGSSVITIGDFNEFLIVDRVGMDVELIPHLFATANNLPSGQRGLYAYWRNTSKVLTNKAFVTLKIT